MDGLAKQKHDQKDERCGSDKPYHQNQAIVLDIPIHFHPVFSLTDERIADICWELFINSVFLASGTTVSLS